MTLKSTLEPEIVREQLLLSPEFKKSESTSYGNQLKYRQSLNELFISSSSKNTILISENAGHGGLSEIMAMISIKSNSMGSNLDIIFKTGGLPFNWIVYLFTTLAIMSIVLFFISYYFIILTVGLASISLIATASNKKLKKVIIKKIEKVLNEA